MKFLEFRDAPVEAIQVGPRLRTVDADWADALAGMIAAQGLQHPISVFPVGRDRYTLMAGAHRLAAVRSLGLPTIQCGVFAPETENVQLEARLHEIIENIGRRELSVLDRAANLAELKRVHEALYPGTRRGVAGGKARQNSATDILSFAESVAAKTGLSARTIRRAVALLDGLDQSVIGLLQGLKIADNGAQLRAFAKLAPDVQIAAAEALAAGARNLREALHQGKAPAPSGFDALVKAWMRANAKERRRFLKEVGVSDSAAAEVMKGSRDRRGGRS